MRHLFPFLVFTLAFSIARCQDHQTMKKNLSRHLREVFDVWKTDWKQKDGRYVVLNDAGNQVVKGTYSNGKKCGTWCYFNDAGLVVQKYDFDHDSLLYAAPDSATFIHTEYQIPQGADETDKVQGPYKIGGPEFGFFLLYDERDIPSTVKGQTTTAQLTYIFTVSEKGELEDYSITIAGGAINDMVIHKTVRGLPRDAYTFSPAILNGHPVRSKLAFTVPLNVSHVDMPGTNNIVTQHPTN